MARGLRQGDGGTHLITLHPPGGAGSDGGFHDEPWLDFNLRQKGHVAEFNGRYDQTRADYDRTPVKPVLDAEPIHEGHPVSFDANKFGHPSPPMCVVRFIGICLAARLVTPAAITPSGNAGTGRKPVNNPLQPWPEATHQRGTVQMQDARALLESRPFLTREPDPNARVASAIPTALPGAVRYYFSATRDALGG